MASKNGDSRRLVLTGWYYPEYLAAAAGVYGAYQGKASVFGVSMAELVAVLESKGRYYDTIDILGVGLTENLARLAAVVKTLVRAGVRVTWYSREKMPADAEAAFAAEGSAFSKVCVKKTDNLLLVVADAFAGITEAEMERLRLVATATAVEPQDYAPGLVKREGDRPLTQADVWQLLFLAAGYAHRSLEDEMACADLVKALADRTSVLPKLPMRLEKMMDNFLAGYSRELIGSSKSAVELRARLMQAAKYEAAHVLILGETGSGKQVAAEFIHYNSPRRRANFRHYNCAYGGNDDLLMDRLFGHEKGAFTGADSQTTGLLEEANGGTLFLDEIGETEARVQAMLLTVLETGTFIRVGGNESKKVTVDVRLVCATNRNLQKMVLDGKFRLDLYMRICEFPIRLVPLRERMEDVPALVRHFWNNLTGKRPTRRQLLALQDYTYPGNVRELLAILKQAKATGNDDFAAILSAHKEFHRELLEGLALQTADTSSVPPRYPDNREELLCHHAVELMGRHGKIARAAEKSGVSVNTLKGYLKKAQEEFHLEVP